MTTSKRFFLSLDVFDLPTGVILRICDIKELVMVILLLRIKVYHVTQEIQVNMNPHLGKIFTLILSGL